jgi:hypothetical protein
MPTITGFANDTPKVKQIEGGKKEVEKKGGVDF